MSVKLRQREGRLRTRGTFKGKRVVKFYLDINENGNRYTETLPIIYVKGDKDYGSLKKQREKANAIRLAKENEIQSKGNHIIPADVKRINFCGYWQNFNESYLKKDVRMFTGSLNYFVLYLEQKNIEAKKFELRDIDFEICKGFADFLKTSALSGETPENYFRRFAYIIKLLVKKKWLYENPIDLFTKKDKVKIDNKRTLKKQILTKEEIQILLNTECNNEEVKRAFIFACFTGLGLAEIKALEWSHLKNGELKIKRRKTNQLINFELPKTAQRILSYYGTGLTGKVFSLTSSTSINKSLKKWLKTAKIDKHITFYCGRHCFAVLLLEESETNLKTVADCLGHATTDHTIKYLNYVSKSKDKAISKLPDLA